MMRRTFFPFRLIARQDLSLTLLRCHSMSVSSTPNRIDGAKILGFRNRSRGQAYSDRSWNEQVEARAQANIKIASTPVGCPQNSDLNMVRLQSEQIFVTAQLLNASLKCEDEKSIASGLGWAVRSAAQLTFDEPEEGCTQSQGWSTTNEFVEKSRIDRQFYELNQSYTLAPRHTDSEERSKKEESIPAVTLGGHAILSDDHFHQPSRTLPRTFLFTRRELHTIILPVLSKIHKDWIPKSWVEHLLSKSMKDDRLSTSNGHLFQLKSNQFRNGKPIWRPMYPHELHRADIYKQLCALFGSEGGGKYTSKGYVGLTSTPSRHPNKMLDLRPSAQGVDSRQWMESSVPLEELNRILAQEEKITQSAFNSKLCTIEYAKERRSVTANLLVVLAAFLDNSHSITTQIRKLGNLREKYENSSQRKPSSHIPASVPFPSSHRIRTHVTHPSAPPTSSLNVLTFYNIGDLDPLSRFYFSLRCPEPSNYLRHEGLLGGYHKCMNNLADEEERPKNHHAINHQIIHSVYSFGQWHVLDPKLCDDFGEVARHLETTKTAPSDGNNIIGSSHAPHVMLIQSSQTPRKSIQPRWLRKPFEAANDILSAAMMQHDKDHTTHTAEPASTTPANYSPTNTVFYPTRRQQDNKSRSFLSAQTDPLWFKGAAVDWLRTVAKIEIVSGGLLAAVKEPPRQNEELGQCQPKGEKSLGVSSFTMRLSGIKSSSEASEMLSAQKQKSNHKVHKGSRKDFTASVHKHQSQNDFWLHIIKSRNSMDTSNRQSFESVIVASTTPQSSDRINEGHSRTYTQTKHPNLDSELKRRNVNIDTSKLKTALSSTTTSDPFQIGYKYPYWIDAATVKQLNLSLLPNAVPLSALHLPLLTSVMGVRSKRTVEVGLKVAVVGDYYTWRQKEHKTKIQSSSSSVIKTDNATAFNEQIRSVQSPNPRVPPSNDVSTIPPQMLEPHRSDGIANYIAKNYLFSDLGMRRAIPDGKGGFLNMNYDEKDEIFNFAPKFFSTFDVAAHNGDSGAHDDNTDKVLQFLLEWLEDIQLQIGSEKIRNTIDME